MSSNNLQKIQFKPVNNHRLLNLCGPFNKNIQQVEQHFNVNIDHRSNMFHINGNEENVRGAIDTLNQLYKETLNNMTLTPDNVYLVISQTGANMQNQVREFNVINTKNKTIRPRSKHQADYIHNINQHDINFAIGPAGTGKTYLAVACAVEALEKGKVQRLIFVRPAVEAGEKLGFLPGDMVDKVLPYLRPIYDALYEMLGFQEAQKLIQNDTIEIAPLAFMRGRTLNDAFIILDEAQNTTLQQMKMFLTRIGFGSTAVITGDITQVDLPNNAISGLSHATTVVKHIKNICLNYFQASDVVRHPLVAEIIQAYDNVEGSQQER